MSKQCINNDQDASLRSSMFRRMNELISVFWWIRNASNCGLDIRKSTDVFFLISWQPLELTSSKSGKFWFKKSFNIRHLLYLNLCPLKLNFSSLKHFSMFHTSETPKFNSFNAKNGSWLLKSKFTRYTFYLFNVFPQKFATILSISSLGNWESLLFQWIIIMHTFYEINQITKNGHFLGLESSTCFSWT